MLLRKPLLLLLFIFCCAKGFAATFVVTSNADSGPGTLRDALTQVAASDTTKLNYITFNITDQTETGRTITILTPLPGISSNLVIDGTSQPGSAFGVSNARVIIQPGTSNNNFDAFSLSGVYNFQFYGMYIRDFNQTIGYRLSAVFYISSSENIQIGAPGKGNVFANDGYVIENAYSGFEVSDLKFYSNLCGFEPDGVTIRPKNYPRNVFIDLTSCKGDIEIGGDNITERNFFGCSVYNIMQDGNGPATAFPSDINIKNNYFDFDVNGNPVSDPMTGNNNDWDYMFGFINEPTNEYIDYPYNYNFINNKIQNPLVVWMYEIKGNITFQGNQILPGVNVRNGEIRIAMTTQGNIQFGGDGPGQANTIYQEQLIIQGTQSTVLQRNSIYCVPSIQWNDGSWIYSPSDYVRSKAPQINITKINSAGVYGTATPGSEVQLFWDDDCVQCEPQTYFTTVYADESGNWSYNGTVNKGVIASATLNGYTQVFTEEGGITNYNLIHAACGNNGAITGITTINSGGLVVTNDKGQVVGTDTAIKNLPIGNYKVTTNNGSCSSSFDFQIIDATPQVDTSDLRITQPSCGQNNGSITGLYVPNQLPGGSIYINPYSYKWLDANNNVRGTSIDVGGLEAGTYRLEITYDANPCTTTYGPITLKNAIGPNIDQSHAKIQPTNCGQTTGSITNLVITGTGNLKYSWTNSQQQSVGTDSTLTSQPAGSYQLKVTDDTQCGPVYTTAITIPETNGITINEASAKTTQTSCGYSNGMITGIQVAGATQYQWTDAGNNIVSTTPALTNVPAGTYTLTASNTTGCSKTSKPYTVTAAAPTKYPAYSFTRNNTCANGATGSIGIITDTLVTAYRWVNSQNDTIGAGSGIDHLAAGTYSLYLIDKKGCRSLYSSYNITTIPALAIQAGSEQVTGDHCNLKEGSITGIKVMGGRAPYTYNWTDVNGNTVSTGIDLNNVGAGTYTLIINDASGCSPATATYSIQNTDSNIPPPSVNNIQLCSSGSALVTVNNPSSTGIYNLYDSEISSTPIDQQIGGKFKVKVTSNTSFYITRVSGNCESSRVKVDVTVGLSTLNIANTFTPNGDGINDYWKINNIENYPQALVQIFTRDGQKIFESKGYEVPFDGTYKGKKLPSGVYYFIINLHSNCNLLAGSLTIVR